MKSYRLVLFCSAIVAMQLLTGCDAPVSIVSISEAEAKPTFVKEDGSRKYDWKVVKDGFQLQPLSEFEIYQDLDRERIANNLRNSVKC